jgi:hypothetical protein
LTELAFNRIFDRMDKLGKFSTYHWVYKQGILSRTSARRAVHLQ